MAEQARTAYEKVLTILAAAGFGPADVTRITENVTIAGLDDYAAAEAVRQELLRRAPAGRAHRRRGPADPPHRAAGGRAARGRRRRRRAARRERTPARRRLAARRRCGRATTARSTCRPCCRSTPPGRSCTPGDLVGQYAYCLDRAGELLAAVGLSLDAAVTTYDYSTPATRDVYRRTHRVRRERLGGAGVYPGAGGILMSRLHHPDALVALDVTASRHPLELVNPGWSRYDTLTYAPGVRAGRTLYMSGFAALDMRHAGGVAPRRRRCAGGGDVRRDPASCWRTPGSGPEDLVETTEYCVASALPDYRAVAGVRERLLSPPWPASTGAICAGLLRPEFLLEVFPTAVYPR